MTRTSTRQVLGNIAAELADLSGRMLDLEICVARLVRAGDGKTNGASHTTLQDFDLLNQSLTALTMYLRVLEAQAGPDEMLNVGQAISVVHLGAMAERLRGEPSEINTEPGHDSAADIELF